MGCGPVKIVNTFVRVVPPDVCNDWHGDGIQGYDGPALTVRNVTLILVETGGCGGTAPFFYPHSQGNTRADIDRLLVVGGGYAFRLGTPGTVSGLKIVRTPGTTARSTSTAPPSPSGRRRSSRWTATNPSTDVRSAATATVAADVTTGSFSSTGDDEERLLR